MIYNGVAVREQLSGLRDSLVAAKARTDLDPFDDAMFNAIHYMLELSDTHSNAVEALVKTVKKMERKAR